MNATAAAPEGATIYRFTDYRIGKRLLLEHGRRLLAVATADDLSLLHLGRPDRLTTLRQMHAAAGAVAFLAGTQEEQEAMKILKYRRYMLRFWFKGRVPPSRLRAVPRAFCAVGANDMGNEASHG